jgi:HEAT repeat protein
MKRMPLILLSLAVAAAQPRIQNAQLETRNAASGLDAAINAIVSTQSSPAWIGWAVKAIPNRGQSCCWHSDGNFSTRGCWLEGRTSGSQALQPGGPVMLEASAVVHILLRIQNKQVSKIRTFTSDCELDAGNTRFVWLTDVKPAESASHLAAYVPKSDIPRDKNRDSAVNAIALHGDPSAAAILERFLSPDYPEQVRKTAVFWIGSVRGRQGFEALSKLIKTETSAKVRESAAHALTLNSEPGAMELVIQMAKTDNSPNVRGQALFWLAQQAGQKAVPAIRAAMDDDPEVKVKEKAVFALSQLPKSEGVPLLIDVAQNNRHPTVRKQAMFWLGQSKDPRALAFFEKILSK